ncbi:hypothetical protein SSX86_031386 [Deinandra increscens subsp. villosa]|uniref:SWIM-type domain-containing protein n=1 Tax=Deinandra increscens subsp. villosa TaxID=3103831 RepID=A0AAP0C516_9ASTR
MDDNAVADLPFDSAPDRSETFVDANSDFDIDHIDSHQLIERSDETSSSATFIPSSSSSGNPYIPDNEPVLSFLRVEDRGTHRHSGDVTKHRYILCNRAGKPKQKTIDSSDKSSLSTTKTVRSSLTDCDACIRVKFDVETRQFVLYVFREAHNHELIGPDFMDFTKRRRKLDFSTQQFIHQMSLNKLGPNIAHRVQSSLKGGHHNVHGSTTDFKNFSRSIRLFIGNRDAKLILGEILANTDLRKSIHKLVWNLLIDKETFEERWHELLAKYDLTDHEWLSQIYEIRSEWVPAFFRDVPMSCLMKTTSRSESSNAHFKVNSSLSNTLLQFLMCFDTALDWQRNNQRKMEFETNTTTPELHTPLPIERHAAAVYTSSLFKKVQKEIKFSLFYCPVGDTRTVGDTKIYTVSHNNKNFVTVNRYEVLMSYYCFFCNITPVSFNVADQSVMCSCLLFPRIGYLCRHVYHVFRFYDINRIPDRYINRRWTRNALPARVYAISNRYSVDNSETGILRNEIIDTVSQCIDHLRRQPEQLAMFSNELKEIKRRIFLEVPRNPEQERTSAIISDILRQPEFGSSSVVPTQGIRNKGCVIRAAELAAASSSSAAVTNACSSSGAFPNSDQVLDVPCVEPPNSSATRRQPFRAARRAPITDDGSPSTPPSF